MKKFKTVLALIFIERLHSFLNEMNALGLLGEKPQAENLLNEHHKMILFLDEIKSFIKKQYSNI